MGTMKRRLTRIGNRFGVWLYRKSDGRLGNAGKQIHVLMITTPGRRSGVPRSTCVRFLESDGQYVVWGTGSGSRTDPDWFRNVRAAQTADVQIGARHLTVRPRELLGEERDAVWKDVILRELPGVEKYAQRAGRTIPVAFLDPLRGDDHAPS